MARPYSRDLRDRVVGSLASGRTCRATAALFGVSVASVVKWSQRWRASGSVAAKPMGGGRPLRLKHEGITFKKSLHASEQDRADIARRRTRWKLHQSRLDPQRLVFIDKTWAKTNMTRRHGRCHRGARLVAKCRTAAGAR
jgi:transposase